MQPHYTRHVGQKFYENGEARPFAGNSIICPVPGSSHTMKKLIQLRNSILKESWHTHFALLPPASYHMTIFDLLCDQVRVPEHWSDALRLDESLQVVDTFVIDSWLTLSPPPYIAVRFRSLEIGEFITIRLEPEDQNVHRQMRLYRDLLSEAFHIRHPNHEDYYFHISMAYAITSLSEEEQANANDSITAWESVLKQELSSVDLLPPRLTFFADMTHFSLRREVNQAAFTR